MMRAFGYFVSNVVILLLFNYFPNVTIELIPAIIFIVFLTLLNWTIIPVIKLLALPINFLTFGLVNAAINLIVLLIMFNAIKGIDINATLSIQSLYAILLTVCFGLGHALVNNLISDE